MGRITQRKGVALSSRIVSPPVGCLGNLGEAGDRERDAVRIDVGNSKSFGGQDDQGIERGMRIGMAARAEKSTEPSAPPGWPSARPARYSDGGRHVRASPCECEFSEVSESAESYEYEINERNEEPERAFE
jgi:hypothetical protein